MAVEKLEVERLCIRCRKETVHHLVYVDGMLKEGTCTGCGRHFHNRTQLLEMYGEELLKRIATKPIRLAKELLEDPVDTIKHIPGRLLKKPFSEAKKLEEIIREEEKEE